MSTFIIRVLKAQAGAIRGQIEHVRSGESTSFSSADQLLAFLRQMSAADSGFVVHLDDVEIPPPAPAGRPTDGSDGSPHGEQHPASRRKG